MPDSRFSAADAALGYLYQVRCALLWTLQRLKTDLPFLVSIETLDDVTFECVAGEPTVESRKLTVARLLLFVVFE